MANEQNLKPFNDLTEKEQREIARKGGIASGIARKEKATMKKTLELMLEEIGDKDSGLTYRQLATLGLIKGAILGNSSNYKTILETTGEIEGSNTETPSVQINIVDNNGLEKVLYDKQDTITNEEKDNSIQ